MFNFIDVSVTLTAPSHQDVDESTGVVEICVSVSSLIQSTFEVLFSTVEGSATGKICCVL